jgi:Sulfatase-modifying factor enzyme 1
MKTAGKLLVLTLAVVATPVLAGTLRCPPDSAKVGNACIDLYEASVWQIDPAKKALVKKVESGKVTLADLMTGGAMQLAPADTCSSNPSPYGPNFPDTGNWTPVLGSRPPSPGVYAVSIPGVLPSACITWFQANEACALSGKRLIRNGEWQRAAASTPDPGTDNGTTDCAVNSAGPVNTGSRSNCKSAWGAFDMVGNVEEWVEDWGDMPNGCTRWSAAFGSDLSCFGGAGGSDGNFPGAFVRGGFWLTGAGAGVFEVVSVGFPAASDSGVGFRCAR